jgi:hypothetical protein
MTPDEAKRLLGGYATGNLTPEEREALYSAALEEPLLFEALAKDQALRDVLEDASARAELLSAVEDRPFSIYSSLKEWFERPKSKILVTLGAVLLMAIGIQRASLSPERHREQIALQTSVSGPDEPSATQPPQPEASPRTATSTAPARQATPAITPSPAAPTATPTSAVEPQPSVSVARLEPKQIVSPVLGYSLSVLGPDGRESPVPADHEFSPEDRARVRVTSSVGGSLLARAGTEIVYAGSITPGTPVLLRREFQFANSKDLTIDLELKPPPAPATIPAVQSRSGFRATPSLDRGVNGVVGGVPPAAAESMDLSAPAPAPVYRLRVELRGK